VLLPSKRHYWTSWLTRTGKALWNNDGINRVLKNETYAGTTVLNRMTEDEPRI
jgi:hypothetical protein